MAAPVASTGSIMATGSVDPMIHGEGMERPARIARVERYVIRGGKEGYERLLLLSRDRWPDTAALLERPGLARGMRCVDLGCGGGAVTMEIARLVAPVGSVAGVDMDEIKLGLARQAAAARGLGNVEFRPLEWATGTSPVAMTWCTPGTWCNT
jgi:2-polyprenyl-3-methyl-5-hydroxy-6-metoxy-1,4-benzoquinol methylase